MMKDMNMGPVGCVTPWLARIGLGLALAGFGVNHYRFFADVAGGSPGFHTMAMSPFSAVPALAMIAGVLAYIVPALEIVGGLLFATRQLCILSKFCILATLGGILGWAGLAMMVGTPDSLSGAGQAVNGAILFLVGYVMVKKMKCCCKRCSPNGCGCGAGCACGCASGEKKTM